MRKQNFMKHILICLALFIPLISSLNNAYAASFSISTSATSISNGGTITVSINASGCEGSFTVSASNGASVTGNKTVWSGESTTIKAGSSSFTITVSPISVADNSTGEKISLGAKTKSVTVKAPSSSSTTTTPNTSTPATPSKPTVVKSSENHLKSLDVEGQKLLPDFNANTTDYSLNVASEVTSITIKATAKDSKATLSGVGKQKVEPGKNTLKVIVKAEDGSKKTYTLTVNVDVKPSVYLEYNNETLGIMNVLTEGIVPEGFEKTTMSIDSKEVVAYTNAIMNKTILYCVNEDGYKKFYIYEEGAGLISSFTPISVLGHNIYIIDIDKSLQQRENMTYTDIEVDGEILKGWTFNDEAFANYYLFYAMNAQGQEVYYQFEKTEQTLQLYSNALPYVQGQQAGNVSSITVIVCVVITAICLIGMIVLMVIHMKYKKKLYKVMKDNLEMRSLNESISKCYVRNQDEEQK